jgi:hypothetical protein
MYPPRETVVDRIGRVLRTRLEDSEREALPKRWAELILALEEQERRHAPLPSLDAATRLVPKAKRRP